MLLNHTRTIGIVGTLLLATMAGADPPQPAPDSAWNTLHQQLMNEIYTNLFNETWNGLDPAFDLAFPVTEPGAHVAISQSGLPLTIEFGSMIMAEHHELDSHGNASTTTLAWTRVALEANDQTIHVDGMLVQFAPDHDHDQDFWTVQFLPATAAVDEELLWEWQRGPTGEELAAGMLVRFALLIETIENNLEIPGHAPLPNHQLAHNDDPPDDDPKPSLAEQCRDMLILSLEVCRQEMQNDLRECLDDTSLQIIESERRLEKCLADAASISLQCVLECRSASSDDERAECLLGCLRTSTRMVDQCERERRRLRLLREAQYDCFNNRWISLQACVQASYLAYANCLEQAGDG